jgi:hypothetical protein
MTQASAVAPADASRYSSYQHHMPACSASTPSITGNNDPPIPVCTPGLRKRTGGIGPAFLRCEAAGRRGARCAASRQDAAAISVSPSASAAR